MDNSQNEIGTKPTECTEPLKSVSSFVHFLLPKDIFSPLFWKTFLIVLLVSVLLFLLEFLRFSTYDREFSYRHLAIVLFSLSEWAFCVSIGCSLYGFRRLLPILCIPFLIIGMDYSNDPLMFISRFNLYTTIFFSMLAGSLFLIVDLLAYYFRHWILSSLRIILFLFVFLFPLLLIGNRVLSGSGIDKDALIAIRQTDISEAYHFFFEINNGALLLVWLAVCLAVFGYIVFFVFPTRKSFIDGHKKTCIKKAVFYCMLSLLPYVFLGWFGHLFIRGPYCYQILSFIKDYNKSLEQFYSLQEKRSKGLRERLMTDKDQHSFNGKYVLVIGESLNRNRMGCYGFSKETTPFQSEARNNDNFVFFNKAFSCHVHTQRVVPLLLTDLNQYNGKSIDLMEATSIIDIAKAYGFHTAWISGQERISVFNSVISAIAEEADQIVFQQGKRPFRDQESVKVLDSVLAEDQDRSFVVVHLYGNHFPYYMAYPSDLQFDELAVSPHDKITQYDASVFYNDQIISQMFEVVKKNDVDVMIYVSDHSEVMSFRGAGHDTWNYVQEMAEIPWWIYMSDQYKKEHPDIVRQLQNAMDEVVTNDLVFNLLLRLMGFNNSFVDETLLPGSDNYRIDEHSARTLYGKRELVFEKE